MTDPGRSHLVLTVPNAFTLLRLAMIPFFVLASLRGAFTMALILFVTAALTDAVDGFLARRLDQRSRLGALLDPAADKTMMVCGYLVYTVGGVARSRLPDWLTFTVFARDVLIVFFAYLLYTRVHVKRFPPSLFGKMSTLTQAVALSVAIGANTGLSGALLPLTRPLYIGTLVLTITSGLDYLRHADAAAHGEPDGWFVRS